MLRETMRIIPFYLSLIISGEVLALSCITPPLNEQVKESKDIFIGEISRVISVEELASTELWPYDAEVKVRVELYVLDVIRGEERTSQIVAFSYKPKIGEKYIIFDKSAFSSNCDISLSTTVESAGLLLEILDYDAAQNRHYQ